MSHYHPHLIWDFININFPTPVFSFDIRFLPQRSFSESSSPHDMHDVVVGWWPSRDRSIAYRVKHFRQILILNLQYMNDLCSKGVNIYKLPVCEANKTNWWWFMKRYDRVAGCADQRSLGRRRLLCRSISPCGVIISVRYLFISILCLLKLNILKIEFIHRWVAVHVCL